LFSPYLTTSAVPLASINVSISSQENVEASPYIVCFNTDVERPYLTAYAGSL